MPTEPESENCMCITDIDGNCYATVLIDDQLWMKENLKVTHFNNGDTISIGYLEVEWNNLLLDKYPEADAD